jgi:hypothetical protein
MTVPAGYPNDSFLVGLQSGEDYLVRTPQDRARGVGENHMTINIDAKGAGPGVGAEVKRAVEMALREAGNAADQRMRTNYVSV